MERKSTVDVQINAGDIFCERAREKSDGICEFIQFPDPAEHLRTLARYHAVYPPKAHPFRDAACRCDSAKTVFELGAFNRSGQRR